MYLILLSFIFFYFHFSISQICVTEETNDYLQNMLLLPVTHIDDYLKGKFSMATAILMMMRQEHHYITDGNTITAKHNIHQTNATSSPISTHSVHRYAESDGKRHTRSGKTGQLGECSRVHPESIALLIGSVHFHPPSQHFH